MPLIENMTPKTRVLNALEGKEVDRTPISNPTNVATVELMDLVEAPFPEANRDPELNARLAATGYTELGFDSIMPVFSIIQESSALGCEIQWEIKDNWPTVRMYKPIWNEPEDIHLPKTFWEHQDIKVVLKSLEILQKTYGKEVAIIGKAMGPWTLAYHVFGVEKFLLMSIDDPEKTKLCLDKLKEISVAFSLAQIEAGADVLTFPDHATGDLVSGEYYKRFLLELHQEMEERIPCPIILHICGNTLDRLDYISQTGMAAFHIDSKNDPHEAMKIANKRIQLVGNLNNPELLYSKEPEDIRKVVFNCLDAGMNLIAPECAIPLATKLQNLIEIPKAVKEWHKINANN